MTEPIKIFRGDDTDFIGNKVIEITLETDIDLSGITADFLLCGFKQHFENETVASKRLEVVISHEETKRFPLGRQLGTLVLKSADGKIKHVDTQIEFFVTNKTGFPMFCGDEQIKTRFGLKIKWDDIRDTPTTLEGYGITDAVKSVNGNFPDEDGNVEIETGGVGTSDYRDLENKPSINGNTLSGNKTAAELGLASGSDLAILQRYYIEEKRKIDPRFGVADNITVVIDTAGVRHEVVTEGEFVPTGYGQDAHAEEIYLAPSVNAIGEDVNAEFTYTRKIVCYGNITSISRGAFGNAYFLEFLSLAGQGQTDIVANGWVDFSMCASSILVVIPDAYYQDETSAFWRWADYTQGAGGVNYLRMCNFAKASNPRRNPYIVETSYAASDGTQEKSFIIPDYQWDVKWAKRWGEPFFFEEGDLGNVALNDICGASVDYGYNCQATLSNADVMMGRLKTTGVDCSFPFIDSSSGGVTIEAVVSGFGGYAANVDFGGMKIEGRTLQILNSSGYDMALSAYSIGASLTSFVFRASRAGASFQWLLNLGRAVFTTPEEWDGGDYSFDSDGLHIACDNGQESFSFYALRIYNAFLTDAQIMEHARLDAERFNLTEGI